VAAYDALHLGEFVHETGLVLQPAGGIDEQDIDVSCVSSLPGIEDNCSRIRSRLLRDHGDIIALTPHLQLLNRGGAKGIAGSKHDRVSVVLQVMGKFADRRCLTGTVDTHHEDDEWAIRLFYPKWLLDRFKNAEQRSFEASLQRVQIFEFVSSQALLQVADDQLGRVHSDIRHDKQGFKLLQYVFVDLTTRNQVREIVCQPVIASIDSSPEAFDEAIMLLRLFFFSKHRYTFFLRHW